jgi:hypothetical protein
MVRASAGQAVYHDFIVAPTTCAPAKRLHCVYTVEGVLDAERLHRAIRFAVSTHESLRTSLQTVNGELLQVIRDPPEITETPWSTADWDGCAESIPRIVCDMDDWWTVPRQLSVHVVLAWSPAGQTLVACLFNHACGDGHSAQIVADLIWAEYERPGAADLARVEQFDDYYASMLHDGETVYEDWLRHLASGAPSVPQWMLDQKAATQQAWTRVREWSLSPESVRLLRSASREYRCSPFEVLAAGVGLYFRRQDGRPARIGVIHGGRHGRHGFDVVGLLRSYLVDVVDPAPWGDARSVVTARAAALRHGFAHYARMPYEEVCLREKIPTGWRAGQAGLWEVELNGAYADAPPPRPDGHAAALVPADISDEAFCENSGPLFLLYFTLGRDGVEATLRYIDPPVTDAMAERVATEIELMIAFLAEPGNSAHDAPAFARTAREFAPLE